jgi:hypothetical protein
MIYDLLTYWVGVFTTQFQELTDDELQMTVIKKAPFQDDPIRKAPYLIISLDTEHGRGITPFDIQEIGGPETWKVTLSIKAAPRSTTTAERAYWLTDVLIGRLMYVIQSHALDTFTTQSGAALKNRDWNIITRVVPDIRGGEREWIPSVTVEFFCIMSMPPRYGSYPDSTELVV